MWKFLLMLFFVILLGGCVGGDSAEQAAPPPEAPVETMPPSPTSEKTVAPEILPLKLDLPFEGSHFGFMHPERALKEAMELGVHWARPHPGPFIWGGVERWKGSYDFRWTDEEVKVLQGYDFTMIATIWPYSEGDQQKCREKLSSEKVVDFRELGSYRQKPCDMEAYVNFVKTVVERYDGDGIEDMPGLKYPVKYWEVLNEPSMKELVFFSGSPEEYLEILKATYEAVKEADQEAMVLNGGIASFDLDAKNFWQRVIDLGGVEYFDIFNHHSISRSEKLLVPGAMDFMRKNNIQKPFWIPEVEFEARGLDRSRLTPEEYAGVMVRAHVMAFGEGVDKLFYVGLDESPGDQESWLLTPKGRELNRQATYHAYATMVEKLDYFTSAEKLNEGKYKFAVGDKMIYVLWGAGSLPWEITGKVRVTDIYGKEEVNEAGGIILGDTPVYVELESPP